MAEHLSDMVHASQAEILQIEDDAATRYAVGRVLHQEGFTVREAATGAEGLRLVKERPDLVILDVQLPDLSGFEVCRRIKADPATAMIPVLHLSAAHVTDKDQITGLEGGADGYLVHPVDPGVLVATVRALLRMRQAEEELRESSRRIENILERVTDAFFALDREWRYIYLNERALDRVRRAKGEELTREELMGKNCWEEFPETVGTTFYQELHRALREQRTVEFETYSPPADGWVRVHAYPSKEGLTVYVQDTTERKRAEEELRQSEERFRATFEQAAVGIAHNAPDGKWLRVNQRLCDIVGYTCEELLEKTFQDITHPDDVEADLEQTRRLLAGEILTFSMEKRYIKKDGSVVWIVLTVSLVRDPSGEPGYFIAVIEDIDDRKQAEEALQESSRRIEDILESITEEFTAVDREWRYTYVNERVLRGIEKGKGLTREEVLGQNIWELYPELVGTTIYQEFHAALSEQKTVAFEAYSPLSDRWLEMHAYPSEEGLSVYAQDITERKRVEKEIETRTHQQAVVAELGLRASTNEDLQSLMDEAVALVARTLGVEYCKIAELLPGGEELLLRSGAGWEEGLVGSATEGTGLDSQTGYTLLSEEPVVVRDLATETRFSPSPLLLEHEVVSGMTVVIPGRDGPFGVLGAHTKSHWVFTEDDVHFLQAVANVLATAVEHKVAEERIEEVREAERGRIARELHDEALQDLSGALVEAQLLRSDSKDPKQVQRAEQLIAGLDRVGQQLRSAVHDLRLGGERDQSFHELLETRVELQRAMGPERQIHLQIQDDGVFSGPLGETGREVLRIVGEALNNSRRHSGASNVWVGVWSSEGKLRAEVEDDGRGYDASTKPSATTGGGLGIKGMRERARALGGDLKIESEPGKGTKARFELALKKERKETEEEVRVLLVEDHSSLREALASVFQREAGFEVLRQAGSLAEARRMLEGIDVAVIDLTLPDGYGGDLIRELREANPQAQVLVLSGSLDRAEIARAVEAGAAGVLHKTAHLDEVVESVRRLRVGETLMPLEEVVGLMRFAGSEREQEYEARQAIEKLTAREIEILQALADGLDSERIAERLHISLRTERNHMSNILAKLEVHSQLQALVFALRHGVVEID